MADVQTARAQNDLAYIGSAHKWSVHPKFNYCQRFGYVRNLLSVIFGISHRTIFLPLPTPILTLLLFTKRGRKERTMENYITIIFKNSENDVQRICMPSAADTGFS
jgi:hypothetical protein